MHLENPKVQPKEHFSFGMQHGLHSKYMSVLDAIRFNIRPHLTLYNKF